MLLFFQLYRSREHIVGFSSVDVNSFLQEYFSLVATVCFDISHPNAEKGCAPPLVVDEAVKAGVAVLVEADNNSLWNSVRALDRSSVARVVHGLTCSL